MKWIVTLMDGNRITFIDRASMDYFITRNYLFVSSVKTIVGENEKDNTNS